MKVHELLSDEGKWIKGNFAKDALGMPVRAGRPEAVCWCLLGAMFRCYPSRGDYLTATDKLLRELKKPKGGKAIADFNDRVASFADLRALLLKLDI